FCHVGAQAPAPYNPIKPSCRPSLPATGARNVDTCAVKTLKKRRLPLNTTRSPLNGFNGTPEVLPAAQEAPQHPRYLPLLGPTWSLCVLTLAYLHHSTTGYALPALLPIISEDLHLVDTQAATLTAGYTVLYALAMLPLGIAADRVQSRPRLLAWGIAAWSLLTLGAARTHSFAELLAARVGFAGAQATQNPVCFALIPDLFPKNRTRAMALYNAAIYAGRALSFGVLMLAVKLGVPKGPFYQRVYDVGPEVYAPLLAVVIPVGGLLGGVGTGLAGDWLQRRGLGSLLTVGSNLAAAPVLAASMLMPDHRSSMAVLLLGFALSEAWRAPAAVALRDVSPPGRGAAASALHLCLRNLVGGVGPLAVAALAGRVGLQHAMLLVPGCFFTSGLGFWAVSRLNKAQAG
ncbi:hypothetical protein APUTEX25_002908, partial [Auxenochlorella protothecoides]